MQLPKKSTYSKLKTRILDVIKQNFTDIEKPSTDQIRLWHCKDAGALFESFNEISQATEDNVHMKSNDADAEVNSGVEFPGDSLEQYIGTSLTFEERNFANEAFIAEVAAPNFVYKYQKAERAHVGQCEWCNQRNLLTVGCKCKRVRYCDDTCMKKDQRFHVPNCSALADNELNDLEIKKSSNARNGLVGLSLIHI